MGIGKPFSESISARRLEFSQIEMAEDIIRIKREACRN
jgi:hypothetical protein